MPPLTEGMIRGKTRMDRMDEVKNLNLWGQDLDVVDVLAKLINVEVLSLSVNQITTLRDFRHCQKLQELYLRKNEVADVSELQYLSGLNNLKILWLSDNPCSEHPYYRQLAIRVLPSLEKLDNIEVTDQERQQASRNPELDKYIVPLDPEAPRPTSRPSPARSPVSVQFPPSVGYGTGGGRGAPLSKKNILYAVMALVAVLDVDDLTYVRREIEQRLDGEFGP
ncbi:hypothetical protein CEUSTIGMA_g11971.t1 [Chlamydomonas eustigma]|uniref:U2A'/phosphoprotein 32 family A C-terminal domain-containing protein n=1 Tax=Chlamydomonas eustigma TaxID=1157962 RepID=A0A250XP23_9CHLO|nr:hypothetical protein CEUSTIGMA_g11971.t1 [Chlamydomonas eustigma]|eukprot:GAX84550.1 hypothetical protein CEUSTIGMA_g11971.t1 [Chlamydomonas eustigma]